MVRISNVEWILMDSYIWFDKILLRWFIVNMKGSEVRILTYFSL